MSDNPFSAPKKKKMTEVASDTLVEPTTSNLETPVPAWNLESETDLDSHHNPFTIQDSDWDKDSAPQEVLFGAPKAEAVETPKAEAVEAPKPEAAEAPKPEAVEAPKPEAVEAPKPEAVETPKPEAAEAPKPEAAEAPKPEAVETPKPEAAEAIKPEAVEATEQKVVETVTAAAVVPAFSGTTEAKQEEPSVKEVLLTDEVSDEPITVEVVDNVVAEEVEISTPTPETTHTTEGSVFGLAKSQQTEEIPTLTMDEHSCRSCAHYFFGKSGCRNSSAEGECRRNAPRGSERAQWPIVDWDSWCGEWEAGMDDEDMARMAKEISDSMVEAEPSFLNLG